jgi:ubiquinone/menaquinone biosynthesis C-methylase UbiE
MKLEKVRQYFENELVVDHYAKATTELGLWLSEEKLLTKIFSINDSILELGCGAGRVALALHELGYKNILGTDYAKTMVQRARHISKLLEYSVPFRVADATDLKFEDDIFNGVIFAFNGFMQIPQATKRMLALREIYRVLRPNGWFVFTSHDRDLSPHKKFWVEEKRRWERGNQQKELDDFGDRAEDTDSGQHYMHVPKVSEISEILLEAGFRIEAHAMRSELAKEPPEVLKFSDDCRFWVVQKPAE